VTMMSSSWPEAPPDEAAASLATARMPPLKEPYVKTMSQQALRQLRYTNFPRLPANTIF
jgi:hypothetical protein